MCEKVYGPKSLSVSVKGVAIEFFSLAAALWGQGACVVSASLTHAEH